MSVFRAKRMELVKFLEPFVPQLLFHLRLYDVISFEERERLEKAAGASKDVLLSLTDVLEKKDRGLEAIVQFLRANDMNTFADTLVECAKEFPIESSRSRLGLLDQFLTKLAKHYKKFSKVWIPSNSSKAVSKIYVPLSLQEEEQSGTASVTISTMLQQLRTDDSISVALVKGDPGTGKTTMMTQLAFEWADKYLGGKQVENVFPVVLYVRLSAAPPMCDDILETVLAHLLKETRVREVTLETLVPLINDMEDKVVVLLDGLDEYDTASTELGNIFAPRFSSSTKNSTATPTFPYKLLIASRPYACQVINPRLAVTKYNIVPLTSQDRRAFAAAYCDSENALEKVMSYLSQEESAVLPVQIPLVLLLVCFLAHYEEEFPSRRTKLYERCLYHMMRRAIIDRTEKLDEDIELGDPEFDWTYTNVAQRTSSLALVCCCKDIPTIKQSTLRELAVSNDSFSCGYLLYKFDVVWDCYVAQFPHRSLQEFFAALSCYQLFVDGSAGKAWDHVSELMYRYDEISMFLLGLSSSKGTFDRVVSFIVAPKVSPMDQMLNEFLVVQNQFNQDILPEEYRFLCEQVNSACLRIVPSLDLSELIAQSANFSANPATRSPAINMSDFAAAIQFVRCISELNISAFDFIFGNIQSSEFVAVNTTGIWSTFLGPYGAQWISRFFGLDYDSELISHSAISDAVESCRLHGETLEIYSGAAERPRTCAAAISIGAISAVWREKFDTINMFCWVVDQTCVLRDTVLLNMLPDDVRHLYVVTTPFSISPECTFYRMAQIQYTNTVPKQFKQVFLAFNKSLLLNEELRSVDYDPSVSICYFSDQDFTIEVSSEFARDRIVLTIIRLALELQCGTTFVEDDLD